MATTAQSKETETLTKYIGDMHALESHIVQAIDKQHKLLGPGHPEAKQQIETFRNTLQTHLDALESRLNALGGSPTHPVKEIVAAGAGIIAGLYDKVRTEEASKDLRDDYTAINHSIVSYIMLHTTALAFNDQETADLCKRHLTDNARFVMNIIKHMPELVIEEFRQDGGLHIDEKAVATAQKTVHEIWTQPSR